MGMMEVVTRCGETFEVDTSDKVCGRFGFRHNDRVMIDSTKKTGTIMGVKKYHPDRLWIAMDDHNGCVTYLYLKQAVYLTLI